MNKIILIALVLSLAYCKEKQSGAAESNKLGAGIYANNCASCHGEKGLGDGPAGVAVKAKNFTEDFKYGSDLASVINTISNGSPANPAMVAFKSQLNPEEIKAVAQYVIALSGK